MSEDYIYAVTRVHARETGLLGKNDLERLLACPDEKACLQVLQDKGWGTGEPSPTAEGLLAAEEAKTWDFLQEVAKDPAPLAPLLVPIDGNNLKAAIKCAATGTPPQGVFLPGGQWEPDSLLEMAKARDFSPLPQAFAQAAAEASRAMLQTGDGQLCDVLVDRACLEEILRLGKASGLAVLERYGQWTVATADIQTAARACKAGKNREFLELALAPCDSLDVAALAQAAGQGMEPLLEYLESTPYSQGAQALRESFSAFEKWRDDQAMELVKGEKAEYESAGPLFAYAVARRREADTVRVILSCKRNGLEDGRIRERLRETYV